MGTVSLHTKYNQYFGENINLWKATDFIAALTAHLPPKKIHLVRYYGLYSSRTKGKRNKKADEEKAQEKLTTQNNNLDIKNILNYLNKIGNTDNLKNCLYNDQTETMMKKESRKAWARLIQKIYEVNPLVCEKCGCEMRIVVAIFLFCRDPGLGFYSENKRMFEKKVA